MMDGYFHGCDSSENALRIGGRMAFKEAMAKAGPTLLEPIMKVTVTAPEEYMGTVVGDLNSRRGQVSGMEQKGNARAIKAKVPLSEMFGYVTVLRTLSSGRATSSMEFSNFEEVPANIAKEIIEKNAGRRKDVE